MPRLTAAQEQQVRDRIIRAAVGVFAEKGYHRATIADVVARSGLSVGAIYTHFSGKDELFLQSCDLISGQGLDELAARLAPLTTTAERLRAAIAYYVESIDDFDGQPGQASLVRAWAEAGEEPGVREMLVRRRERLLGAAQLLLREGIARGELPDWLDADGFARGFMALLDGLLLQRIEAGDAYRPEESVRRANAILDVLLAVRGAERPAVATA
ncbi:MAG TPA: TetR family transcriptional regulator [Candidatus Limnocylindrales bacterium]|nr:TetR family transcriptional regulator [Candidatus Limnocylindrales bacterium]